MKRDSRGRGYRLFTSAYLGWAFAIMRIADELRAIERRWSHVSDRVERVLIRSRVGR